MRLLQKEQFSGLTELDRPLHRKTVVLTYLLYQLRLSVDDATDATTWNAPVGRRRGLSMSEEDIYLKVLQNSNVLSYV